ncbi:MAG: hypothetical protein J5625_10535 [Lachnospiraceae bacterium]|nr:hypothetical protein [Lachnospiraceae bacterium]
MAKSKEESDEEKRKAKIASLRKGPDLDKYVKGPRKRYTTYELGASQYSLNYYTFRKLVRMAGANIKIRKNVLIDLDILEEYLEKNCKDGGEKNV